MGSILSNNPLPPYQPQVAESNSPLTLVNNLIQKILGSMNPQDMFNQVVNSSSEAKNAMNLINRYMEKAVEWKGKHCGEVMYLDAMDESKHANNLLKLFQSIEKPDSVTDAEHSAMKSAILNAYSENMGKFEMLRKAYWS